ncbi:thioredoxin domain-containing protein [Lactiplantibacillus sp. WILCCON 0030]|uniref:Thioredoxin domain-containing protein n=1 Tax=Lactiplantibacillus brownii TaxID=3069269 RepID=A0ABU1A765_9LACO|nr:thioredoxin domain-containing protein [Lactiplantibacillus brownii]MDQ7936775.1 thioredoxin domain-containing protein [Lactiplantibacillus brownii]
MSGFSDSDATTINLGQPQAPHTLTAILNLGCEDTQDWWLPNVDELFQAVDDGQLQVHLKFWNKIKEPLRNGNIANGYIDYQQPEQALTYIEAVFQGQDDLRGLANAAVPAYLEQTYGVKPYAAAAAVKQQIDQEVAANGITSLPTLIFDGKMRFDEQLVPLSQLL